MDWELDHVFLACPDVVAAKSAISKFGMVLNDGRIHRGQGTANVYSYFENAFFELLYPVDNLELDSEAVRPLGLKERIEWKASGACPFGVCLRPAAALEEPVVPPVECWPYAPACVPLGSSILIATPRGSVNEPLVFISARRHSNPQGVATTHRGEERTLTRVQIQHPENRQPSAKVRWFAENSPLSFSSGAEYRLELVWGDGRNGFSKIDTLPLCVSW